MSILRALLRLAAGIAAIATCIIIQSVRAETIVDEWPMVTAPPPPAPKPRCIGSIAKVKPLLAAARAAGVPVVYTLGAGGKPADIAQDLAPAADEPAVHSGVDKFVNTDLEKILREKGITTVVVVGTAAHGAVLYTASAAAIRGLKVIVPVDGISGDNTYTEQYVAWHFANVPVIASAITLTTINDVKF